MVNERGKFQFAIDRGGTFTDVFARCPDGRIRVLKLLSEDPQHYEDAPTEGIRRILKEESPQAINEDDKIDESYIESIRMGTTVATNALLERKGERMVFVTNKGFKDILLIGNQARPNIFDLNIRRPELLYEEVVEVDCRVIPALENVCELGALSKKWRIAIGQTGQTFYVTQELDLNKVAFELLKIRQTGIDSIAIALAHSYSFAEHELAIGDIAHSIGFSQVSLSHVVMPMMRLVPRAFTACSDAYLTPHVKRYLEGFAKGFDNSLLNTRVLFMKSDGGLTAMSEFNGSKAVLSGPAGGVVGYAKTTWKKETNLPVIGFDMGGTSTDVSRYAGNYEHVYESTTAGITIQAPQLDVNTVAAGGGSMLFYRSGLFVVGPESAGANPGPACYQKGGPLTVTDANLALGRLLPEYFPKIFGPKENESLDKDITLSKFGDMVFDMEVPRKVEEIAMGFIRVANEAMCRPIRALTQARGYDTAGHALACFGGAGGQHACAIARSLGMSTVFIHKYAGILSAYGIALADVVYELQEPTLKLYEPANFDYFDTKLKELEKKCLKALRLQGYNSNRIVFERYLHMRYDGTDCALMCSPQSSTNNATQHGDFMATFVERYQTEFGFKIDCDVVVDDIMVKVIGKTSICEEVELPESENTPPVHEKTTKVYFEGGYKETKVFLLSKLMRNNKIEGPAIIMDNLSTILVEPACTATITKYGDIKIMIGTGKMKEISEELDSIQLSIFSHRFMSIAEQMGRILQRTAKSTNIKERLDFSCALFGPDGGLVSNAPHIPVHLGSMQEAVQYQLKTRTDIKEGDVILSNHPAAGGSHLPDFTVITPVFHESTKNPIFFVASRGHHADIGGITPGSMPPHSTSLDQEGAAFKSFIIVKKGTFQETEFTKEILKAGGRNLQDNLSDLRAQVAANQKGIQLVKELIGQYGLKVVQAYMKHIQSNAELSVRDMLRNAAKDARRQCRDVEAEEFMDDGTIIKLKVKLDGETGSAICDFTGSGLEVWGNCNAPRAITLSAIIYCLRCMIGHDVPLNQGCLTPVEIIVPKGSILDPSEGAAVVGGNVLTSQRIVDVVLKAFQVCAASQGCMNNITFGNERWGNYETVAGGSGAGPNWNGVSGVHTHMTNTRITDIELLELRYPIYVMKFKIREGSGGAGRYRGGDGVERELMFRTPVTLSVLTERRVLQPYGLKGGQPGARGVNTLKRANGRMINLGSKTAINVQPGDIFEILTPGGGGYGVPGSKTIKIEDLPITKSYVERGSLYTFKLNQESV
ncbi:PREDICTED: 5-oxoprolinase [Nicrophorus vespilloides]|uniref:5-oxoprolinase n=1 Tax=Nicrophorus vespilloides TaxID=110193 RepID=A0ABM1MGB3_NICVS|nr:PREDICTED: 5-oxoprolinase [Nicrophorus vespilloides]XP_017773613.1 PREDICTED: 5-oxoprolinase [Nicrophorus vespilloides]